MSGDDQWCQCELTNGEGEKIIAWIQHRGAKRGARVELKDDDSRLWEVTAVYDSVLLSGLDLRNKQDKDRNSLPSVRSPE